MDEGVRLQKWSAACFAFSVLSPAWQPEGSAVQGFVEFTKMALSSYSCEY